MLKQVTTTGQVSGSGVGELPDGYLPLTGDLQTQAATATSSIERYVPPTTSNQPNTANQNSSFQGNDGEGTDGTKTLDTLASDPVVRAGPQAQEGITPTSNLGPLGSGLALALGIGLLGLLIAPLLFRGRGSP